MYNLNRLYQSNIFNLPKQHIHTAYQSDPLKPKRCSIHHPPGVHCSIATLRPFTFEFHTIHIYNCGMAYIFHCLSVRFFPSLVINTSPVGSSQPSNQIQILQMISHMINHSDPIAEVFKLIENRPPCPSNFLSSPFPSCKSCQMSLMSEKEKI